MFCAVFAILPRLFAPTNVTSSNTKFCIVAFSTVSNRGLLSPVILYPFPSKVPLNIVLITAFPVVFK